MIAPVELTHAIAASGSRLHVSGRPETMPPDATFSRLFRWDATHATRPQPWTKHDVSWAAVSYARYVAGEAAPTVCILSEEGDVEIDDGSRREVERIPEAGLYGPASRRLGYVSAIRQIGSHLYVCGDGGQVYKRVAPASWACVDDGLVQGPDAKELLLLSAIGGAAEDDLYVAGDIPGPSGRTARLFHRDGAAWEAIELPEVGPLRAIHVEHERRVWLAGERGTLLVGDHHNGFVVCSSHPSSQFFRDLTVYQGTLYLASNHGLFKYDEERRRVVRARTDLAIELSSLHTVDHVEGVLWCVGAKDIARFDGTTWTRIHHPDNPRLGG